MLYHFNTFLQDLKNMAIVGNMVSCLAVTALLLTVTNATSYTVGDADGWTAGFVDYKAWASGKSFKVGDELGNKPMQF